MAANLPSWYLSGLQLLYAEKRQGASPKEIGMLPYHTAFVLHQEQLGRYQAEAKRAVAGRSGLLDSLSRAASRALENLNKRNELRPAI